MSEKEDPILTAIDKGIAYHAGEIEYLEKWKAEHLAHLGKPAKGTPGPKKGFKKSNGGTSGEAPANIEVATSENEGVTKN